MLENENWDILLNTDKETSFNIFFIHSYFHITAKHEILQISNPNLLFEPA